HKASGRAARKSALPCMTTLSRPRAGRSCEGARNIPSSREYEAPGGSVAHEGPARVAVRRPTRFNLTSVQHDKTANTGNHMAKELPERTRVYQCHHLD